MAAEGPRGPLATRMEGRSEGFNTLPVWSRYRRLHRHYLPPSCRCLPIDLTGVATSACCYRPFRRRPLPPPAFAFRRLPPAAACRQPPPRRHLHHAAIFCRPLPSAAIRCRPPSPPPPPPPLFFAPKTLPLDGLGLNHQSWAEFFLAHPCRPIPLVPTPACYESNHSREPPYPSVRTQPNHSTGLDSKHPVRVSSATLLKPSGLTIEPVDLAY